MTIEEMDAWSATLRAQHTKLYEELRGDYTAQLEITRDPFERERLTKKIAKLDGMKADMDAGR